MSKNKELNLNSKIMAAYMKQNHMVNAGYYG